MLGVVFALGAAQADAQVTVTVPATVTEGDVAEVKVEAKVSIPEGATAGQITVTLSLDSAFDTVVGDVSVDDVNTAEETDYSFVNADLKLDYPAGNAADGGRKDATLNGTIYVQTANDLDAEDERVTFELAVTTPNDANNMGGEDNLALAATGNKYTLKIDDNETQTYVLALAPATQKPEEGDPVTVSLKADPAHSENGEVAITLHLDQTPPFAINIVGDPVGSVTGNTVMLGGTSNATAEATITIMTADNDENRSDDTITLTAYSGTAGKAEAEDTLEIKLTDKNELPAVTAKAIVLDEDGDPLEDQPDMVESIMEGQMVDIEITVVDKDGDAKKAGEALMVSLMPTGDASDYDYRLNMHPVAIKSGAETGTARLTVSEDQDIGMETLMFDADVAGEAKNGDETRMSMGVLSLEIMDTTMKQVEAKKDTELMPIIYGAIDEGDGDDDMFSPGEMIEVDASMLFIPTEGYSISYTADSDMMDVAEARKSGSSMVTVKALMEGGPAHITIKAIATPMTSGAKPLPQTTPNVAQVTFPVTVVDTPLVVTVSTDPMDMVEEGGMVKVTATSTTRDILAGEEVVVMLDVNGPATGPDSITIPAGMSYGSIDLTVNDDEMVAPMGDIVITATGPGIEGATVLTVSVTEDDMETTYSVAPAAVSVTEGGEGMMITATASQAVLANTEVMLMHGAGSASADDYGLVPVMITIMAGETEGSTTLTATDDDDYEGMEAVTLNAMIGTMSVGMVEVTIEDDDMPTTYELAPATGTVDEGGEAAVITATASQAVMEDTMVSLTPTGGTASADDYSVDAITITAGETSGSTMLMANDDHDVEGMETLTLQGSIGAMIIGSVMFEIGDNDMEITVELSSEDEHIVEGDMDHANGTKAAAVLTATASSAVPMDTVVTIMRDGTSSAGMDDFTAEPITISAGETMGTTMVMAGEDGIMEDMEMLTLYGMVDGMNTNMVSFYIWDAAVPALPLIAQLLLAAFLAIGGYRRYLRR